MELRYFYNLLTQSEHLVKLVKPKLFKICIHSALHLFRDSKHCCLYSLKPTVNHFTHYSNHQFQFPLQKHQPLVATNP